MNPFSTFTEYSVTVNTVSRMYRTRHQGAAQGRQGQGGEMWDEGKNSAPSKKKR